MVFIAGLEENLFPSQFCVKPSEIEEERRLLYVAITRAMERCYLSFARQRFRNGQMAFNSPSRFLNDIDKQFFRLERQAPKPQIPSFTRFSVPTSVRHDDKPTIKAPVSGATSPIASAAWKTGDRVNHRVFGDGTVSRVYRDEVTENDKIEINFDKQGTKTLLLTHAKLERI